MTRFQSSSDALRAVVLTLARWTRAGLLRYRRPLVVAVHLAAPVATSYAAFWLRFDGVIPARELWLWWSMLPWVLAIRAVLFVPFRLYEGLWRYSSMWDLRNLMAGVAGGSVAAYALVHRYFGYVDYPRSVFIIDALLLVFVLGGLRLVPRIYRDIVRSGNGKRVLIVGAGDMGEMIVRDMSNYRDYRPVGFLDNDRTKRGLRIHGVPVLGTLADLPRAIARTRPDEVLMAVAQRETALAQELVRVLRPFRVPITTVPPLRHLIDGKIAVSQIRQLSIEDLLARPPVGLDDRPVRELIEGRSIMVTGAGGSIGSELCRQIAAFRPSRLILFERYENSLYTIAHDLEDTFPDVRTELVIGDVTDEARLDAVLSRWQPRIILHAAAHKHVPLMEFNCCEAVKNNVMGTRMVAAAAQRHGIERFVLISTDKAVEPTSVMGATKRVAELTVQALAPFGGTRFTTVRFGNVLGSNGSVVPRFLKQIHAGGPVTVTHPEIERYFMLISEAVQLVLHAAALGEGDHIYVLDMGEQIKLVTLADNLIRLSGFGPDDIKIEFVGLRPGEKLSERLHADEEELTPSPVEKVLRVASRPRGADHLSVELDQLIRLAKLGEASAVVAALSRVVPSFTPDPALLRRNAEAEAHIASRRRMVAAAVGGRSGAWQDADDLPDTAR
ncbi:MAG: polysaccharide biosynthesis protein [Acidobacteria bacterium]|nr:polysaccharide biosynthesis protein [Acidobacteriota bacterium]